MKQSEVDRFNEHLKVTGVDPDAGVTEWEQREYFRLF